MKINNCGQQIIIFLLGLSIGALSMVNPLCKQKDSTIRLLMNNSHTQVENIGIIPKNLPIVNIK